MDKTIIIGLIQNTAMLMAFSMIYDYSWVRKEESRNILYKVISGIVVGCIGIILMLTPWKQVTGLVFDTRSVLLSLTGLFFGIIPTATAVIITSVFRVAMGGPGAVMGVAVIIISSAAGILWRTFRPGWNKKRYIGELVALGFVVHILMLACTLFLPVNMIKTTIRNIALPLFTIYPAGTILLGILMVRQYSNYQNKVAAEKLRESERRFSEMIKNTSLYSVILDTEGRIVFANDPILRAIGYRLENIIGENVFQKLIPKESQENALKSLQNIISGKTDTYNFEMDIITRDGSEITILWNNTVLRDERKNITGAACIGEDITIRKRAEEELIRAKQKAEESDKLKSVFLANMSHEIRTPMNAIMGFSSLLGESGVTDSEKEQYIKIIKNAGDKLLKIINDIIDVSKLEANVLSIHPSECKLYEIFSQSVESMMKSEYMALKPYLTLKTDVPENLHNLRILCDSHRFQQVLDNLITNAVKYTEKGFVETGYRITTEDSSQFIEVFVRDTGIGIPDNMSKVIFERFRQVEEDKFHEGTGLGLSISKGIVTLLGGKIWYKSELNKGTSFFFTIPYVEPKSPFHTEVPQKDLVPDLKGKTVLIAEDDYSSFLYLSLLMKDMNARVLYADNGNSLMKIVNKEIPDLILLDINMPVKSGFECLDEIRSAGMETKIIAQTAYAMPEEKEQCISRGCHGYIAKPIDKSELYTTIQSILKS